MQTSVNTITEQKPFAYQMIDGEKKEIVYLNTLQRRALDEEKLKTQINN